MCLDFRWVGKWWVSFQPNVGHSCWNITTVWEDRKQFRESKLLGKKNTVHKSLTDRLKSEKTNESLMLC